jgi:hypothetical protein
MVTGPAKASKDILSRAASVPRYTDQQQTLGVQLVLEQQA